MNFRQLTVLDTQKFCDLIIDMYAHLENLEWFTPMPFDYQSVKGMIEKPRFYIIGAFEGDKLCGVSSLDYKCGKLIGVINFPAECNTDKLVEIAFTMVHSSCRGKGLMKQMINFLLEKIKNDGFEWAFSKVHQNNIASLKSLFHNNFEVFSNYTKPVNKDDFISLSSQDFFSPQGKENAIQTLSKYGLDDDKIFVDYYMLIKKL